MFKNFLTYTLFSGTGSILLAYFFVPEYLTLSILSLILMSLLMTVYEFITDERKFSLNFENVHRGPESDYAVDGNQMSVVYHTIGTIISGIIVLII